MFHQMIKNWIFLKSTRDGLLKNVKDEIFRPLGSRKIQKTKVCTVLWDTLYYMNIFTQNLSLDRSVLIDMMNIRLDNF